MLTYPSAEILRRLETFEQRNVVVELLGWKERLAECEMDGSTQLGI